MLIQSNVKKSSGRFLKYNLWWQPTVDPLSMEMDCISHGGKWTKANGEQAGEGLAFHYRRFQEIAWPERIWEKGPFKNHWSEACLNTYLENSYIGVMGCAAAGKSDSFGCNVLTDWYCHSTCTTGLVSSTDLKSLEIRIWGMIKKYHKLAKRERSWIPGYLIEGKQMLILDPRSESGDGRDFKNGIIAVACFPSGTLVDTPIGPRCIESLRVGDEVINASGTGKITSIHSRLSKSLIRIHLSDGRFFDCTEEHPILTSNGWVNAIDLQTSDMVLSSHETMRIMRGEHGGDVSESEVLLPQVCDLSSANTLQAVPFRVSSITEPAWELCRSVLLAELRQPLDCCQQGANPKKNPAVSNVRQHDEVSALQSPFLLGELPVAFGDSPMLTMRTGVRFGKRVSRKDEDKVLQQIVQSEGFREIECSQEGYPYSGRVDGMEAVPEFNSQISHQDGRFVLGWEQAMVPTGHSIPASEVGCGNRRRHSRNTSQGFQGQNTHPNTGIAWVDRVEILQPESDVRFDGGVGGYTVHNIEVDTHPSYSVNGVIVHNCKRGNQYVGLGPLIGIHNKRVRLLADECNLMPRAFLDSAANLSKCEDFKLIGLGNPNETTNAHGVLCEPHSDLGGWEGAIDQQPGTKTWKTKFPNGVCLQLPGSDSPNMKTEEGEPPPFPFLITREQMRDDAQIWGVDDWHFTMMNEAKMPRGQGARRVLTRQMCQKFGAFKEPNWRDSRRTRIAFLDAAYRGVGGDRCVFGELQFGPECEPITNAPVAAIINQGINPDKMRNIITLIDLVSIPISAERGADPAEDQIVQYVMKQCESRGIGPQNFFFDSGMRTSLVTAFCRLWDTNVNSIDCGGKPSETPVSSEIQTMCRDYYSKFITEIWFNVRMAVESQQFRGMTEEVCTEFSQREWKLTGGNKIEVESKEEMKIKTGRSPDLADAVAIGVLGARRRGFIISKMSAQLPPRKKNGPDWRDELKKKARKHVASGQLNFSV